MVALIRGFARHRRHIGNFWVDMTRTTLYILLPLSTLFALLLVGQGVVQNFSAYKDVTTVEPLTYEQPKTDAAGQPLKDEKGNPVLETLTTHTQTLPWARWPRRRPSSSWAPTAAASSTSIRRIRSRTRRRLTNFFEMLAILLIPAALCYTFGRMVGDTRQGWAVLAAMIILFVRALRDLPCTSRTATRSSPRSASTRRRVRCKPGGNMEGKETRFGMAASALLATATTAASNGASTRCTIRSRRWAGWCRCC